MNQSQVDSSTFHFNRQSYRINSSTWITNSRLVLFLILRIFKYPSERQIDSSSVRGIFKTSSHVILVIIIRTAVWFHSTIQARVFSLLVRFLPNAPLLDDLPQISTSDLWCVCPATCRACPRGLEECQSWPCNHSAWYEPPKPAALENCRGKKRCLIPVTCSLP